MNLTPDLYKIKMEIEKYAIDCGLDFFPVIFEVLDWKELNEVASFGGFPNRYPHWRFGMEYEDLSKRYAWGLSKIYEMVINNDPCYAYLLYANSVVDQKLVMAHVYAHCDFFKNNVYFAHTNRKMMDEMGNHRTKIMRYVNRYGHDIVEDFIDACLSIDTLIDCHAPAIKRIREREETPLNGEIKVVKKLRSSKPYLDKFINPPDFLKDQQKKIEDERRLEKLFPESPERDVMGFLTEYAALEKWQRDILSMLREEAYYFLPQGQTKIMNEGWASYFHSKIMTTRALKDSEVIDYADHHSGTVAPYPGRLNPYKMGLELFKDIEERWNKGKFGKEYNECSDLVEKARWDKNLGLGRQKMFEVRKIYSDITFIDEFLTPEFCRDQKLFMFAYNPSADQYEVASREFKKVKDKLLFQLTNFGHPIISVVNGNYKNRGELLLKHQHDGIDLRPDYAKETLKSLYKIWGRPVNIETISEDVPKILSFDGEEYKESRP
ncbi:MAG: SpoVR family protein [Deltaproteobacteria bacterium]|nr:SpoVR family protein [Deltaproteobacteria bacterium]